MKIHTKTLECSGEYVTTNAALFAYGKEVLGDGWTADDNSLTFTDAYGGKHGWRYTASASYTGLTMISNGLETETGSSAMSKKYVRYSGVVWESGSGSVGLGFVDDAGNYVTWYLLIKFDGKYNDKDVYGVSASLLGDGFAPKNGEIMVNGDVNVGACNHIHSNASILGSGVYLHPLYDPVSGLTSSDIFGVQSLDNKVYGYGGHIVKQGSTSYMSILGTDSSLSNANILNTLFVKM